MSPTLPGSRMRRATSPTERSHLGGSLESGSKSSEVMLFQDVEDGQVPSESKCSPAQKAQIT
jgi:hypothetical protein